MTHLEDARETLRRTFPDRLAKLLAVTGVRQFERDTGISRAQIIKLKKGRVLPTAAMILALSWYFEVSIGELIDPQVEFENREAN